jgi:hypothetical protein
VEEDGTYRGRPPLASSGRRHAERLLSASALSDPQYASVASTVFVVAITVFAVSAGHMVQLAQEGGAA